jgi:maltose alpha-D-glucosyltransferase/alpha-amylase
MISVRQLQPAFGRGSLSFLYPTNRKVLAFTREHEDRKLLCVFNLARSAQAVELDLSRFRGTTPIELTGNSPFPSVGELPYMLTLPGYGFYWFLLASDAEAPAWRVTPVEPAAELATAVFAHGWKSLLEGRELHQLERASLPEFVARQRWFSGKNARISGAALETLAVLDADGDGYALQQLDVTLQGGEAQRYFLPLSAAWGVEHVATGAARLPFTLAKLRRGARVGALLDAAHDERFARALADAVANSRSLATPKGELVFQASGAWDSVPTDASVRSVGAEQSNSALIVDERILVKLYRRLREGVQPEIEIARFLSLEAGYKNTPALLGLVEHRPGEGPPTVLGALFEFVRNQGDCWQVIVEALERHLDDALMAPPVEDGAPQEAPVYLHPLDLPATLGRRTAEMHQALAIDTPDPAFAREPVADRDMEAWADAVRAEADMAFDVLSRNQGQMDERVRPHVDRLLAARDSLEAHLERLAAIPAAGAKTRIHGDYHLSQVLVAEHDVVIIDFEGEPRRQLEERRQKTSPLRDVAGMLRSLDYATFAALDRIATRTPELSERVTDAARAWRDTAEAQFLAAYRAVAETMPSYPANDAAARGQLELFLLQKAFYEISYESANRPGWLSIPVRGVLALLANDTKEGS